MNQLQDLAVGRALAAASQAGVPVDLIIRGFCCLLPGVPGWTENVRIRSVIGRFLEHSRIFHFANGHADPLDGDFLIGSADWMYRNLSRRVEAATPVDDRVASRAAVGDPRRLPARQPACVDPRRRRALRASRCPCPIATGPEARRHARGADRIHAAAHRGAPSDELRRHRRWSPARLMMIEVGWSLDLCCCSPLAAAAAAFDLQGHRGARGLAPENTIAAFKRALEIGVTTIETDVGITRDGVVVIAHDRRLNAALTRGPDGKWLPAAGPAIRSLSLAELKTYDVGRLDPASAYAKSWTAAGCRGWRARSGADRAVRPRLSAAASRCASTWRRSSRRMPPTRPSIPSTFARIVVDAVRKAGFAARTTLQSFDWRTLVEAKRLAPEIRTACLTIEGGNGDTVKADDSGASPWHAGLSLARHEGSLPKLVKAAGCDIWSPFWRNVTPERVREARALGLAVLPWTVNEPADMEMLIDAGVDGLITDYPDRLRRVLTAKGKPLP